MSGLVCLGGVLAVPALLYLLVILQSVTLSRQHSGKTPVGVTYCRTAIAHVALRFAKVGSQQCAGEDRDPIGLRRMTTCINRLRSGRQPHDGGAESRGDPGSITTRVVSLRVPTIEKGAALRLWLG